MTIHSTSDTTVPDDERDLSLRNRPRKMELAAKFRAHFGEGDSKLPGNIEAQWLNYIEEFERQFAEGKRTTVRALVGNPNFKPLIAWSGKPARHRSGGTDEHSPPLSFRGAATLRMRRSPYGGWDVYQAIVPGWNGGQ